MNETTQQKKAHQKEEGPRRALCVLDGRRGMQRRQLLLSSGINDGSSSSSALKTIFGRHGYRLGGRGGEKSFSPYSPVPF